MSDSTARRRPVFDPELEVEQLVNASPTCCGRELFGEVLDLATGVGLLVFTLAPFALPALALVAVAAVALLIPLLAGAMLAAPILLGRHWWRIHDRASRGFQPVTLGREERRGGVSTLGASGDHTEILGTRSQPFKAREMS